MKVEVESRGVGKAVAEISGLGVRARDLGPIKRGFSDIVDKSTERRFENKGPGWPPLADETRQRKQGSQMLVDTGKLKRAMTRQTAKQSTTDELVSEPTPNVDYARFHQYGTKNMPKRTLVELRPSEARQVAKLVQQHIKGGR